MVKGFRQIASITALSRVFGLVRDMAYSQFFGAQELMDAWSIAFMIPNLARRLFGEGAASASFIPVYSKEVQLDKEGSDKLAGTVVTVIITLLAGLVVFGWLVMWGFYMLSGKADETRLIISLSSIMLPYTIMVCVVAILAGILNVHRHFAAPAAAPIVLNIFIISTILLTGWAFDIPGREQVFAVAFSVLAAGIAQIAIQIAPLRASGVSLKPAWDVHSDAFKKIMLLMGPMILGMTVTQINTLSDNLIAWFFSGSDDKGAFFEFLGNTIRYPLWRGSVSHLYYSQRLYQLPLGILGISLATAIFPVMSSDAARKDHDALCRTIGRGIKGAFFVAIPASVGLLLVAHPLVAAVFEHGKFLSSDTTMTSRTLAFYAIGLCGFFTQQIVTRAFYAMQDSKTPMKSALAAVIVNVILNMTLIWFIGTAGLALSTALCSYLQVIVLTWLLRVKFGAALFQGFADVIIKTIVGTVIMSLAGLAVLWAFRTLDDNWKFNLIRLIVIVPVCIGVYYICSKLLRNEMLSLITGRKK